VLLTFARVLAGLCALFFGRRLFWLFVGVVGFELGMNLAPLMFGDAPESLAFGMAVLAGIIGAAFAYALYELMIGVAGFVVGGYLGAQLWVTVTTHFGLGMWVAAAIGGVVGAIMLNVLFDWALIALSSLIGANFVVDALHLVPPIRLLAFLVLVTVGIATQASSVRHQPAPP
jgi:hypothetical protein